MDIDRFIAQNTPTWSRLEELTRRARRGVRSLQPEELDELVALYQRTSAHLSHARTAYREPSASKVVSQKSQCSRPRVTFRSAALT